MSSKTIICGHTVDHWVRVTFSEAKTRVVTNMLNGPAIDLLEEVILASRDPATSVCMQPNSSDTSQQVLAVGQRTSDDMLFVEHGVFYPVNGGVALVEMARIAILLRRCVLRFES